MAALEMADLFVQIDEAADEAHGIPGGTVVTGDDDLAQER
jgi:hypothetical protein